MGTLGKTLATEFVMREPAAGAQTRKTATLDVVGCGAVTKRFHLPALTWLERQGFVRTRYCVDPDFRAASSVASMLRGARAVAASSPARLDANGAALALIATPPEFHNEWAQNYLEAGAHVLVEKPAVLTMEQFSLLSNIADRHGRMVLVGHVRRLFPSVAAARDIILSGDVGRIRGIEVYEGIRWSWATRSDFPITSTAGGVIFDLGSHALDLALFICGMDDLPPDEVTAQLLRVEKRPDQEPSHEVLASLVLRARAFEVPVTVQLSRREPMANVVRVRADNGELLVGVWFERSVLLRTSGSSRRIIAQPRWAYTTSVQGCFVAEHLEAWRAWADGASDSPLALAHFGLLTKLLQILVAGA